MDRHDWSEADDLIAFYLYRFGTERLPFDMPTIAERRGIKLGSMKMRISNFKACAGTGGLGNIAQQSVQVFEQYRDTPEPALRNLAFPELARSTYSTPNYDELLKQYNAIKALPQVSDAGLANLSELIKKTIGAGSHMMEQNLSNPGLLVNGLEDCLRMAKLLMIVDEYRAGLAKGRQT